VGPSQPPVQGKQGFFA